MTEDGRRPDFWNAKFSITDILELLLNYIQKIIWVLLNPVKTSLPGFCGGNPLKRAETNANKRNRRFSNLSVSVENKARTSSLVRSPYLRNTNLYKITCCMWRCHLFSKLIFQFPLLVSLVFDTSHWNFPRKKKNVKEKLCWKWPMLLVWRFCCRLLTSATLTFSMTFIIFNKIQHHFYVIALLFHTKQFSNQKHEPKCLLQLRCDGKQQQQQQVKCFS